jgi:uncharacterized protein YlxW (UPF0749 family)
MSGDEEKAIIGGLVLEHGEVKRRFATLTVKAGQIGRALQIVGAALLEPNLMIQRRDEFEQSLLAVPERQALIDLVEELRSTRQRRDELQKTIKEYGID